MAFWQDVAGLVADGIQFTAATLGAAKPDAGGEAGAAVSGDMSRPLAAGSAMVSCRRQHRSRIRKRKSMTDDDVHQCGGVRSAVCGSMPTVRVMIGIERLIVKGVY
eukprot:SAG11_NODE_1420_length_4956_cov_5.104797_3_plen_106_part_00